MPIPAAERSKANVCGLSLAGIAGSNTAGGMGVCCVCSYSNDERQKPGRSGQRSKDKIERQNRKETCLGA
jgi:hypothetical protein